MIQQHGMGFHANLDSFDFLDSFLRLTHAPSHRASNQDWSQKLFSSFFCIGHSTGFFQGSNRCGDFQHPIPRCVQRPSNDIRSNAWNHSHETHWLFCGDSMCRNTTCLVVSLGVLNHSFPADLKITALSLRCQFPHRHHLCIESNRHPRSKCLMLERPPNMPALGFGQARRLQ